VKRTKQENNTAEAFAAFIGIDGADQKHQVRLWAWDSQHSESLLIRQRPEKLPLWVNGLRERFCGRRVAICLEQSRGPLIYALMGYDFIVLYPIIREAWPNTARLSAWLKPRMIPVTPNFC